MKLWVPVIKLKAIDFGGTKHAPEFTDDQADHHRPAKKRRTKLITVLALFVIIPVGLIWLVVRGLNAPAEGTIDNSGHSLTSHQARANANYNDSYIGFEYPGNFKVISDQMSAGYMDSVNLISDDHPSVYVAMGLVKEALANDSGLNYRQLHPELYKLISSTTDAEVFSRDQGGSEYTGFISNNGLVLAISLTSVGPTHLADDYIIIANSLSWK